MYFYICGEFPQKKSIKFGETLEGKTLEFLYTTIDRKTRIKNYEK